MSRWELLVNKYIPRKAGNEPEFFLIGITRADKKGMKYGNVICPYCGKTSEKRLEICELPNRSCGCIKGKNISKTKRLLNPQTKYQEVDGIRFYKASSGYWKSANGLWMHRYVWEKANGKLQNGYEIHHKDRDRDNNAIGNLESLTVAEHKRLHARR